jgi:hypothetical protein
VTLSLMKIGESKFGDQNVSEHESILSDQEQIGSAGGKPDESAVANFNVVKVMEGR